MSVSHRRLLVSHHRTLLGGENYYSFHKQEWKTITRLAAKQVRMHVNRAHIDWVHVMHTAVLVSATQLRPGADRSIAVDLHQWIL